MAYHEIQPVLSFQARHHPLNLPQFHWWERTEGIHAALFAGKEMSISINGDGATYQLMYLDMSHPDKFESVEVAKQAAPDFARAVLLYMLNIVGLREDDVGLLMHLPTFQKQLYQGRE